MLTTSDRAVPVANRREIFIHVGLTLLTILVYAQLGQHDSLIYDDPQYVFENRWIRDGLTLEGVARAFSTSMAANWHPITWISHMIDVSVFGLNPGWHHLVNLLIHTANTILLYRVLEGMTGALFRSAMVAALFAIHPLHVESVAWIAERKDLLCAFFGFLAIGRYSDFVKKRDNRSRVLVLLYFAMGLMSKPMLVTLPFVFVLLDYWPLQRFEAPSLRRGEPFRGILAEKIPLFTMSAVTCVMTAWAQRQGNAIVSMDAFPLWARVFNGLTAYVKYIGKMVWPTHLSVFYPNPGRILSPWVVVGSFILLGAITTLVIRYSRAGKYLPVGWFWFLGMLVPVIGIVQVGSQSMADRYTYLPHIGLFLVIVWGISDIWERNRLPTAILAWGGAVVLCLLSLVAWKQVSVWRNDYTLFGHMVRVVPNWNRLAHINLGARLLNDGNPSLAIGHYANALRERPDDEGATLGMGIACQMLGRFEDAAGFYRTLLKMDPDNLKARFSLGNVLLDMGRKEEGLAELGILARSRKEEEPNVLLARGLILIHAGKEDEGIHLIKEALLYSPGDILGNTKLALALAKAGRFPEAVERFRWVLHYSPRDATAHYNLALALENSGSLEEAVQMYEKALALRPDDVEILGNLGAALGKAGRNDQAIARLQAALKIDPGNEVARQNLAMAIAMREKR